MTSTTTKYTKGEIGRVRIIKDFLPSPDKLVPREDKVIDADPERQSDKKTGR